MIFNATADLTAPSVEGVFSVCDGVQHLRTCPSCLWSYSAAYHFQQGLHPYGSLDTARSVKKNSSPHL